MDIQVPIAFRTLPFFWFNLLTAKFQLSFLFDLSLDFHSFCLIHFYKLLFLYWSGLSYPALFCVFHWGSYLFFDLTDHFNYEAVFVIWSFIYFSTYEISSGTLFTSVPMRLALEEFWMFRDISLPCIVIIVVFLCSGLQTRGKHVSCRVFWESFLESSLFFVMYSACGCLQGKHFSPLFYMVGSKMPQQFTWSFGEHERQIIYTEPKLTVDGGAKQQSTQFGDMRVMNKTNASCLLTGLFVSKCNLPVMAKI